MVQVESLLDSHVLQVELVVVMVHVILVFFCADDSDFADGNMYWYVVVVHMVEVF